MRPIDKSPRDESGKWTVDKISRDNLLNGKWTSTLRDSNNLPLWIIAGVLSFFAFIFLLFLGAKFIDHIDEEQRKEELLERESWRRTIKPEYRFKQ